MRASAAPAAEKLGKVIGAIPAFYRALAGQFGWSFGRLMNRPPAPAVAPPAAPTPPPNHPIVP
jgi:hypothetical protein